MRRIKQAPVVLFMAAVALSGCQWKPVQPNQAKVNDAPQGRKGQLGHLSKTAIHDETLAGPDTAVDTALQWAQKCSELSEQLGRADKDNRLLRKENLEFKEQATKLQTDLSLAEKELQGANTMLMDLQKQLENWKASVLGFRQEMRQAQRAQLAALTKVLKLLGGEVTGPAESPVAQTPPATQPAQEARGPRSRPATTKAQLAGEKANESAQ